MRRHLAALAAATAALMTLSGTGSANAAPAPAAAAPQPVTGLSVYGVTNRDVTLGWRPPTDPSVTGFIVRRGSGAAPKTISDGAPVQLRVPFLSDVTTDFGVNGVGLAPNTRYVYSVFTVDKNGVASAPASIIARTAVNKTPASISGTVTGPAGQPLPGVSVSLGGVEFALATTGADGTYTVGNLLPGSYDVCFDATDATAGASPGFIGRCYGPPTWGVNWVVASAGAPATGIDAQLAASGSVSGKVTGPSGEPIADAQIHASSNGGGFDNVFTFTAADGSYTLKNVIPGSVWLCADASSATLPAGGGYYHSSCSFSSHVQGQAIGPFTVATGQNLPGINMTLRVQFGPSGP